MIFSNKARRRREEIQMPKFVLPIALLIGVSATFAQAQPYPSRPIRVVVPFPAAGNVDTYIRQLARQMEISMGQPLVIDNRSGANGIVGCDIVAKSAPDGYTILATSVAFAVNPSMYKSLPYNSETDFTPITNYANGLGYILVAHPSVQANNIKELIEIARKQPLRYSSAGIGNGQHLAGELLAQKAGITLQHIPYKGGGPGLTAVLSGEVHLHFPGASVAVPHLKSGKLRGIGFTGEKRISSLPDLPTIGESGLPGYSFDTGWHAMFAPPKTPAAIVNQLSAAFKAAITAPRAMKSWEAQGTTPVGSTPEEFRKALTAEMAMWKKLVRDNNIKADE